MNNFKIKTEKMRCALVFGICVQKDGIELKFFVTKYKTLATGSQLGSEMFLVAV